jgi:hypothetical protein
MTNHRPRSGAISEYKIDPPGSRPCQFEVRWFDGHAEPAQRESDRPLICVLPNDAAMELAPPLIAEARRHADVVVIGTRELIKECLEDISNEREQI